MTLRTITIDATTHKVVPLDPTVEMMEGAFKSITASDEHTYLGVEQRLYWHMTAAAPEYQEPAKAMICRRCGSDRFKETCKQPDLNCPIIGIAHDISKG